MTESAKVVDFMLRKTKIIVGFLTYPELYPEFFRRAKRKLKSFGVDRNAEKAKVIHWCEQNAVDVKTALLKLTESTDYEPFHQKFAAQVDASRKIVANSPIRIGGRGQLDLIYWLTEYVRATRVIETGVAAGWSSFAFLLSLKNRPGSVLVSTDMPYTYLFKDAEQYVGCVVPPELKTMWTLIRSPDKEGLPEALKILPTIDICHYDSDKSYDGRLWSYPQLWKVLRSGGIFISDDIEDNFGFRDFCRSIKQEGVVVKAAARVGFKYVGILVKP